MKQFGGCCPKIGPTEPVLPAGSGPVVSIALSHPRQVLWGRGLVKQPTMAVQQCYAFFKILLQRVGGH